MYPLIVVVLFAISCSFQKGESLNIKANQNFHEAFLDVGRKDTLLTFES